MTDENEIETTSAQATALSSPHLSALREALLASIAAKEECSPDGWLWLCGTPVKQGTALYQAMRVLANGSILSQLREAEWSIEDIYQLADQWLEASQVHRTSRTYAMQILRNPRPPVVLKTFAAPPTLAMLALAASLLPDDPELAQDLALVLAWLAARAQGKRSVVVPTGAILRGRKGHADAVGITAQAGAKIWPILRDVILVKTLAHVPGVYSATYEIRPEYLAALR